MSGYALIHRRLLGHAAFRNDAEAMAFAWLAVRASWRPARVRYKGRPIALERGQLALSIRDFAEAMDRDKGWIERLLRRLRSETMIETRAETGVLVITICNYDRFQSKTEIGETVPETLRETPARHGQDTEQEPEELEEQEEVIEAAPQCARVPAQPVREALVAWNEAATAVGWPNVTKFGAPRQALLRARLRSDGIDGWRSALNRARASPYLAGQPPPSWFCFDWLVKPANYDKVIDGNYDRQHSASAANDRLDEARAMRGGAGFIEDGRHSGLGSC